MNLLEPRGVAHGRGAPTPGSLTGLSRQYCPPGAPSPVTYVMAGTGTASPSWSQGNLS